MAGIKVVGGGNNYIGNNFVEGYDDGIVIENSPGTVAHNNTVRAKQLYGPTFPNVVAAVTRDGSAEDKRALDAILKNEDESLVTESWIMLGRKYGKQIGGFSLTVLAGVLSASAYAVVKAELAKHSIILP